VQSLGGGNVLWELNSARTAHLQTDSKAKGVQIMTAKDLTRSVNDLQMAGTVMGEGQEVSSKGGRERVSPQKRKNQSRVVEIRMRVNWILQ
jgi:hypothetical protein